MKTSKTIHFKLLLLALTALSFSACPVVRATGDSIEAVGEGAGHAVAGTGAAISDAAH